MVAVTLPAPDDTRDFGRFLRAQGMVKFVQGKKVVFWPHGKYSVVTDEITGAGLYDGSHQPGWGGRLPAPVGGVPPLASWQEDAILQAGTMWRLGIGHRMGLGKTRTAIEIMRQDYTYDHLHKFLVMTPKVLPTTWVSQLNKWWPGHPFTVCMPKGWAAKLRQVLPAHEVDLLKVQVKDYMPGIKGPVLFLGTWMCGVKVWEEMKAFGADAVFFDEAHRLQNSSSDTHKKSLALWGCSPEGPQRVVCLTGTPLTQEPISLHGPQRFIEPSVFPWARSKFAQWFKPDQTVMRITGAYKPSKEFVDEKHERKFLDVMENFWHVVQDANRTWPEPVYKEVPVSNRFVKHEAQMLRSGVLTLPPLVDGEDDVVVVTDGPAEKGLRAIELCQGFVGIMDLDDEGRRVRVETRWLCDPVDTPKAKALAEIIANHDDGSPLVVFCQWSPDVHMASAVCQAAGVKYGLHTGKHKDALTASNEIREGLDVIICQVKASAEGLQLTAAHTAVWVSTPREITVWRQANSRLDRTGQTRQVTNIMLFAGERDRKAYENLVAGKNFLDDLINQVGAG